MKLLCKIFGHIPFRVNIRCMTAYCYRCGVKLDVSYDMTYGDTIVEGEHLEGQ